MSLPNRILCNMCYNTEHVASYILKRCSIVKELSSTTNYIIGWGLICTTGSSFSPCSTKLAIIIVWLLHGLSTRLNNQVYKIPHKHGNTSKSDNTTKIKEHIIMDSGYPNVPLFLLYCCYYWVYKCYHGYS